MKAVVLDSSIASDVNSERVCRALITELQNRDWEIEHIIIREQKIGNCAGDFFCWIRTPGICHINDDNRRIAKAVINSDLTVFITSITFGGYSSMLKRAVDHLIQNISPHFTNIQGETHHQKRYSKYPDLLVVGWIDSPNAHTEDVFRHLVKRNAINLYAEKVVCGIVTANQSDDEITSSVKDWISNLNKDQSIQTVKLPESGNTYCPAAGVQRALLLVGSPKTLKSTSNSLGEYLFERLDSQSIKTETTFLHTTIQSSEKMKALLETIDAVDLVTLAFPLYVDSLPAAVIDALEQIAVHRQSQEQTRRPLFAAISNCGFPEANQIATALAICEIFAEQAKFQWAGGLALGGGHGLGDKTPAEWGKRTAKIRKALDLAAVALAKGQPISKEAQDIMSKPIIPSWVIQSRAYSLIGGFFWKQQAKQYGMQKALRRQPYLVKDYDVIN